MGLGITHDDTDYLIRFLAVVYLQKRGTVSTGHIEHTEAAAFPLLIFIGNTGCAKKAFELVAKVLGGPEAIEIALLALNFLYKLDLGLSE
jgi:hypothetical protein